MVEQRSARSSIKKEAHKAICRNGSVENKSRHKSIKNKVKKAVSRAFSKKAADGFTDL